MPGCSQLCWSLYSVADAPRFAISIAHAVTRYPVLTEQARHLLGSKGDSPRSNLEPCHEECNPQSQWGAGSANHHLSTLHVSYASRPAKSSTKGAYAGL